MLEPLWTSDAIVQATGGALEGAPFSADGVSIDTRTLEPNDLFVALAGERHGHAFVDQAMSAGAAGALVSRPTAKPAVQVDDTLAALEALGVAARKRAAQARRAAVTGSVGKTSVTQAMAAAIRLAGPAHSSVKSYNNHIGVPLTLARMPQSTERAVFEIGMNHAGEITPLSRIVSPHVAVITTVGPVHVENFPDGEVGVARAKSEIFDGLQPDGVAVLNADNRWFELLSDAARARGASVLRFGAEAGCDAQLLGFELADEGATVEARLHGRTIRFPIAQTGAHWGANSLACLLALDALEVPLETTLEALRTYAPLDGRGATQRIETASGPATLIDESYNANPLSMRAALAALGARPTAGRRIAILTDMLELGPDAPQRHAELADPIAAAQVDLVFCAGPLMRSLWDALPANVRGAYAPQAQDLLPEVRAAIRSGDAVMVKGSNGSKAGLIAKSLVQASLAGEPALQGGQG